MEGKKGKAQRGRAHLLQHCQNPGGDIRKVSWARPASSCSHCLPSPGYLSPLPSSPFPSFPSPPLFPLPPFPFPRLFLCLLVTLQRNILLFHFHSFFRAQHRHPLLVLTPPRVFLQYLLLPGECSPSCKLCSCFTPECGNAFLIFRCSITNYTNTDGTP